MLDDLEHLDTVAGNLRRALALRPDYEHRIQAAESLVALLESPPALGWLFSNGMDPGDLSDITSGLRRYAVAHRQTLEALDRLSRAVEQARESDQHAVELLQGAATRGSI